MGLLKKFLYLLGLIMAVSLFVPLPAFATDCSDLSDCFGSLGGFLGALGGIAGGALAPSFFPQGGGGNGPNLDGPQGDDGQDDCTK